MFWVGLRIARDPGLVVPTIAQTLGAKDEPCRAHRRARAAAAARQLRAGGRRAAELAGSARAPARTSACSSRAASCCASRRGRVPGAAARRGGGGRALLRPRAASQPDGTRVAELCRRLDDLPLARRARRRPHERPHRRADPRAALRSASTCLKGGRDADPRQQTLRATIEWSYELLSPRTSSSSSPASPSSPAAARSTRPRRSLTPTSTRCSRSSTRASSAAPSERFWMLETIREYAARAARGVGRHSADEPSATRSTSSWDLAERTREHVPRSASRREAFDQLDARSSTTSVLRLEWMIDRGAGDAALRFATSQARGGSGGSAGTSPRRRELACDGARRWPATSPVASRQGLRALPTWLAQAGRLARRDRRGRVGPTTIFRTLRDLAAGSSICLHGTRRCVDESARVSAVPTSCFAECELTARQLDRLLASERSPSGTWEMRRSTKQSSTGATACFEEPKAR